ncbi:MAG TPA: glycosyltransferase family 1 protein [Stellaceae bacterium]|nr:glycosyltransferase family 1 protein [Stellaceae bacterium]
MIALDLSRLLSRACSATPSGIDRVEFAYARHLIAGAAAYCFTARTALGQIGLLPSEAAGEFVARRAAMWQDGAMEQDRRNIIALARKLRLAAVTGVPALRRKLRRAGGSAAYLVVSHQNLDRPYPIARLKTATGARFVVLIHDLIPIDFPRLTRPGQTHRHRQRITAASRLADAVIVNSAATADALSKHLGPCRIPVAVAPLGIGLPGDDPIPPRADPPYFVCIGTIEARKNQSLLLDIWTQLHTELGSRSPRLALIGQRGFGAEPIVKRIAALRNVVTEYTDLPDQATARLLRGARALLLPSFAEGFGFPVAEALALGVPVLCSDLPALRETGADCPDYLAPGDHDAWRRAIVDYATDTSRRQTQIARLVDWRAPRWSDHFAIAERLIAAL